MVELQVLLKFLIIEVMQIFLLVIGTNVTVVGIV